MYRIFLSDNGRYTGSEVKNLYKFGALAGSSRAQSSLCQMPPCQCRCPHSHLYIHPLDCFAPILVFSKKVLCCCLSHCSFDGVFTPCLREHGSAGELVPEQNRRRSRARRVPAADADVVPQLQERRRQRQAQPLRAARDHHLWRGPR